MTLLDYSNLMRMTSLKQKSHYNRIEIKTKTRNKKKRIALTSKVFIQLHK